MAFLHRTRLFVNDLLSPFGFAINRVEKQPSKCFRTTVSVQERAQLYETSTGRYGAVETIKRHRMPIIFEFEQQFQAEFGTSFQDYVDFVNSISYRFENTVLNINYLIVPR